MDDLFLAVQAFRYPGNYVMEHPTIERIAETLDKFEEDILEVSTATIRGAREATLTFGEPIRISSDAQPRWSAHSLTQAIETRVQDLLDEESR